MSRDAQIAHACPHHIRLERTTVLAGVEVPTGSPISSENLLFLRRDGINLPKDGLYTTPKVILPRTAPYRVRQGSEILYLDGQPIELPIRTYSSKELTDTLKSLASARYQISEINGSVEISSFDAQEILLTGDVLTVSFGFSKSTHRVRSRQIAPSWYLYKSGEGYGVRFRKPLDPVGVLDISYLTEKRFCTRCGGTGVENDFRLDEYGAISELNGHDLLYQIVAKAILTERGSNGFYPWYGSIAHRMVGQKSNSATAMSIKDTVRDTLQKIISVQQSQAQVQSVTLKERIAAIERIDVEPVGQDLTNYLCSVTVRSASTETVTISVVFAVPGSIPLDGELV